MGGQQRALHLSEFNYFFSIFPFSSSLSPKTGCWGGKQLVNLCVNESFQLIVALGYSRLKGSNYNEVCRGGGVKLL